MTAQDSATPMMLELKTSTQALHDAVEDGAFNRKLMKGTLPIDCYVELLAQLFLIHHALEAHLRACRGSHPAVGRVVRDYQFQEPYLREDLAFFGRAIEDIRPLPATGRLISGIDETARENPVGLLGFHYVFEGSNNGSKFVARAVRRAYGFQDGRGLAYLDPYGDRQTEYWRLFKEDMNAAAFSPADRAAIVEAARATFMAMIALHDELCERAEPKAVTA